MEHKMITTTFDLPGYKIIETFGMTRGITVRSRDFFSSMAQVSEHWLAVKSGLM